MRERQRTQLQHPVLINPDDRPQYKIYNRKTSKTHVFTETIGGRIIVGTVVTFDVDVDESVLKLVDGIGAIFGRSGEKTMLRERQRTQLQHPVLINPDDRLQCRIHDQKTGKTHVFTEVIGREMVVDTVVTFDVDEPVLGLVDGIGAIFGRSGT